MPGFPFDACVCNPKVWANAGYTPGAVLDFYAAIEDAITRSFGDITMSYPLLQAGFPRVESATNWEGDHLSSAAGTPLLDPAYGPGSPTDNPGLTRQTEDIIDAGLQRYGSRFMPMHFGLPRYPADIGEADCSWSLPIDSAGVAVLRLPDNTVVSEVPGCPNLWANQPCLGSGAVCGFQQQTEPNGYTGPNDIESGLINLTRNSNAIRFEIYPTRAWEIGTASSSVGANAGLDLTHDSGRWGLVNNPYPFTRSITSWNDELVSRRAALTLPNPYPSEHGYTFTTSGTYRATNPRTCADGGLGTEFVLTVQ